MLEQITATKRSLTDEEKQILDDQSKRVVSEFKSRQLEAQAQRNWDLFYKRNETRFFKDRHWTTREFTELLGNHNAAVIPIEDQQQRKLLEVGCGVGNFIFPLIEDEATKNKYYYYAIDFSPRAVEFVRSNPLYNERNMQAFQCDITTEEISSQIPPLSLDVVTMIFVLSAIHPDKFTAVIKNLFVLLKPGGVVLFRDYGLYDMAQLRFKAGHKIADNFYMRQDGTRCYYFSDSEIYRLFTENGFDVLSNAYVHRRTRNVKEGIDVPRIFLQGKFTKRS